jgi:hypothetical protein
MTKTNPSSGLEPTIECSAPGEPSVAATSPPEVSRAKVGFVAGTKAGLEQETAALVRQRLLAVALVLSVTLALAFVRSLFLPEVSLMPLRAVVLATLVGSYALLQSPARLSLKMLSPGRAFFSSRSPR